MRTWRALLVGAGAMGRNWGVTLRDTPEVAVAGWVDAQPGRAAAAAQEIRLAPRYVGTDLDTAIRAAGADFVVDVTPPEAHHAVTLRALAAGLPVLGEKPLATTLAEAREMIAAAERAGKLFVVSQNRRYDAGLQALRRLITEQTGPPGILDAGFYLGPHFGGFRETMASPLLLDMAIHTFDAARYLSAADPVAVYCEEFNPPWSWYAGGAAATAIFEMTGGLRFTYRGSWCSEGRPTAWDAEWRAVGPHGTATWDGSGTPSAEVVAGTEGFVRPVESRPGASDPAFLGGIAGALGDFLHALDSGATPMGECHDNIRSLAMVLAAQESAARQARVAIPI